MDPLADFANALSRRIVGDVRTDPMSLLLYSTDASNYQFMPLAVVVPHDTGDIIAAMEEAARFKLPVLPRGSGTSLAGQAVNACVVIDTSKHVDSVLKVNAEERWARIEPGMSMVFSAAPTAMMASSSDCPPARSKLIVLEGNCSWWLTESGAVVRRISEMATSGTCAPLDPGVISTWLDPDAVWSWLVLVATWLAATPGTRSAPRALGSVR